MKKLNKGRILYGICIFLVLLIILFLTLGLNCRKHTITELNKRNLQILAEEKAFQVNNFLKFQEEKISILGSIGVFKEVAKYPNDSAKREIANEKINELKDIIPEISVLTKEGFTIVSETDPFWTDYSMVPGFPATEESNITFSRYYDALRRRDYYAIGGPIYDNSPGERKLIGVVAFDVELDEISLLMNESFDMENIEVYLIDESGLLLSGSKYLGNDNKNGILIQDVKSEGAKQCLAHLDEYYGGEYIEKHKEAFEYVNYMGDDVYGAHAYVPSIRGCVIAEQNINVVSKFTLTGEIIRLFRKEVRNEE